MDEDPLASARIQVGARRRYRYGFRWASDQPPLGWDGYLLWFLLHGRATWSLPEETRQISDGTCCLLPVDAGPIRLQCDPDGTQAVLWFHVLSDAPLQLPVFTPLDHPQLAEQLLQQCLETRIRQPTECSTCLQALLYHLRRAQRGAHQRRAELSDFDILCDRIRQDPGERWTARSIADRLGIAERTAYVLFQRERGCSPQEFIMRMRIEATKELLQNSNEPLKRIAAEVGFCDQYALSNRFLTATGMRPTQWRREHGPGTATL